MESDFKKIKSSPLYEELLLNLFSDNVRILEILKRTDVEEALNLYIAVAGDQAFFKVINIMNTNLIWNYWFQRDMAVIYKFGEWDAETVLWETEDKPTWKVYYLWFRYYVSWMQFWLLHFDSDIDKYSVVKFKYLNIGIINGKIIDIRKYIQRYNQKIKNVIPDNTHLSDFMIKKFFTKFVGYKDTENKPRKYFSYLKMIEIDEIFHQFHLILLNKGNGNSLNMLKTYASRFPKTSNTKIVLASCIECNTECSDPQVEKYNKKNIFCDKDCQRAFYKK
jgi:hypothetical protein